MDPPQPDPLPGVPLHTVAGLLGYRCAYSLIIANAHEDDPYGRDSHVPLTARFFNTPEVSALLS